MPPQATSTTSQGDRESLHSKEARTFGPKSDNAPSPLKSVTVGPLVRIASIFVHRSLRRKS
jgi:hypothetical protein